MDDFNSSSTLSQEQTPVENVTQSFEPSELTTEDTSTNDIVEEPLNNSLIENKSSHRSTAVQVIR